MSNKVNDLSIYFATSNFTYEDMAILVIQKMNRIEELERLVEDQKQLITSMSRQIEIMQNQLDGDI